MWVTFILGRKPREIDDRVIENAPDIVACDAIMVAAVAKPMRG